MWIVCFKHANSDEKWYLAPKLTQVRDLDKAHRFKTFPTATLTVHKLVDGLQGRNIEEVTFVKVKE